ncbi:MAG: APC family permease [Synergistaceae bacterium]|nr:APC family permease [Synergistaceae bacterium]
MKVGRNDHLQKGLSVLSAWSMAFGCIVGSGAFIMPGRNFLRKAGPMGALAAMEAAAFIMLIISYSYDYMIRKFSVSGGQFIYAKKAFGVVHGFICAWFLCLCYITLIPINATAFSIIFRALSGNILQFGHIYTFVGYDIYVGELIFAVAVLVSMALISAMGSGSAGRIQTLLVIIMLLGVFINLWGIIRSPAVNSSDLLPMFYPLKDSGSIMGYVGQIMSVMILAPWAYVGFDVVPLLTEESDFPRESIKPIMDTTILAGCAVYIIMIFIAAWGKPARYASWVSYVRVVQDLEGVEGIATFSAANKVLGSTGVLVMSLSAMMAMLTCILGFYTAAGRLLYSMARDRLIPSWFMKLNHNGVPYNSLIFCMAVSFFAPFIGRTAMGWLVDISSIGGAVGMAYTSLASVKFAFSEGRNDMIIFGSAGFIFSVIFAVMLLIPFWREYALQWPSYLLLFIWVILGGVLFCVRRFRIRNKIREIRRTKGFLSK